MLEHALGYARRGWPVLPLHTPTDDHRCDCRRGDCDKPGKHPRTQHGLKDATTDEATLTRWFSRQWPDANVGVLSGSGSGLVILDVDAKDGGLDSLAELDGRLPPTVETRTGGGGRHLLYAHPGGQVRTVIAKSTTHPPLGAGIDVLADGGRYWVAPPSVHVSGCPYEWVASPAEQEIAPLPLWVLELLAKPSGEASEPEAEGPVPEGARHRHLLTAAARMRDAGLGGPAILAALREENATRCIPPKPDEEVQRIAQWISSKPVGKARAAARKEAEKFSPPHPYSQSTFNATDYGNAERLVSLHGADFRYSKEMRTWLSWDGTRWRHDLTGAVMRAAKATARRIAVDAERLDGEARASLLKHAAKTEEAKRLNAMVSLAESERGIPVEVRDLDNHPWLLTVKNGTLDLRSGELLPHERDHLITKLAPVVYDPNAKAPLWEKFLREIQPDPEVRAFLQRACGYALSGSTREHRFFLLYGRTGRNGKGTLIETIREVLGDYAKAAEFTTFMEKPAHSDRPRNDIAVLRGARFVSASEAKRGQRLDEALVKQLTGGDTISCRLLYANDINFRPDFKLFLSVNHRPQVQGTDGAIWARVLTIPFNVSFLGKEDRDLPHKLRPELPGILVWLLRGCLDWQERGLAPPAAVLAETQRYRSDMDVVGTFLDSCCVFERDTKVKASELYGRYVAWCEGNAEIPATQTAFGLCLGEKDLENRKVGGNKYWVGVRLMDEFERRQRDLQEATA